MEKARKKWIPSSNLKAHPMNMPDSVSQYHHSRSNGLYRQITYIHRYMCRVPWNESFG